MEENPGIPQQNPGGSNSTPPPPLVSAPSIPPPAPPPLFTASASPSPQPQPRQPARRGGTGWMIFAILLLVLLAFSILMNISQFATGFIRPTGARYTREAGPQITEVLVQDNGSRDKLAVVEVQGLITGEALDPTGFSLVDLIRAQLRRAAEDSHVKAVILKVDSPGGEVLASDEISRAVSEFQKKTGKPVVAAMGSLAASGGYYVSAPCRWIVANPLTLTGSIGVIMSSYNYRLLMNKVGVVPQVYKSGKFKDMLSGSRDPEQISAKEREMLQSMVDQTFARFKWVVAEGRNGAHQKNASSGRALREDWGDFADGRVLTGEEAFTIGFVDELGNFEDALKRGRTLGGISSANVIQYQQRYDLADLFRIFGRTEGRTLKVDLGMELPSLKAGQMYFLSPTFAP